MGGAGGGGRGGRLRRGDYQDQTGSMQKRWGGGGGRGEKGLMSKDEASGRRTQQHVKCEATLPSAV